MSAFFRPSLDRIPSLLALLAIVVQCFVVQAHIHAPLGGGLVPATTGLAAPANDPDDGSAPVPRGKFPGGDDPSNCRLCQELVHTFVTPSAALLAVALILTPWLLILSHSAPITFRGAHIWQSRAPPFHS
jgi:hypothetical protein